MERALRLQIENFKWRHELQRMPKTDWPQLPEMPNPPFEVWRSRKFLVMIFRDQGFERLSILRTEMGEDGRYLEGISWDDMQRLKAECGRREQWAVECFPPESEVVNVQNMRHLFVLPAAPDFGWKRKRPAATPVMLDDVGGGL